MADVESCQVCCLLVGPPTVGKSTLFEKLTNGNVVQEYSMTSRIGIGRKSHTLANNRTLELAILDSPGKEMYQKLVEDVCKKIGTRAVLLAVFDVTNRTSLVSLEAILGSLFKQNSNKPTEQPSGILVANKTDLVDRRIITSPEGQQKAKMLKLRYFECSALSDISMQEFDQLLLDLVQANIASASESDRNLPVKASDAN